MLKAFKKIATEKGAAIAAELGEKIVADKVKDYLPLAVALVISGIIFFGCEKKRSATSIASVNIAVNYISCGGPKELAEITHHIMESIF